MSDMELRVKNIHFYFLQLRTAQPPHLLGLSTASWKIDCRSRIMAEQHTRLILYRNSRPASLQIRA